MFLKSQAEFRKLGDNVTAAQLDGVCNLCNQAYVNLIREFATDFQDAGGSLPDPDVESFGRSKLRLASEGGVDVQDDGTINGSLRCASYPFIHCGCNSLTTRT